MEIKKETTRCTATRDVYWVRTKPRYIYLVTHDHQQEKWWAERVVPGKFPDKIKDHTIAHLLIRSVQEFAGQTQKI